MQLQVVQDGWLPFSAEYVDDSFNQEGPSY
jgi:hypothetical protein